MKPSKMMGVMVVLVLLVAGCDHQETAAERGARFQKEAKQRIVEACSNDVVGITRIVKTDYDAIDSASNPSFWKGSATVEFVNKVGGIERTNLIFKFRQDYQELTCSLDNAAMLRRRYDGGEMSEHERRVYEMQTGINEHPLTGK